MCDPVTLTVLAVAATVVTAGSEIYAGQAAYQQGKFENEVMNRNAQLEQANITDAQQRRATEQMQLWRRVTQRLGEQRAEGAAQGLDVNFGSVADIQQDTLMIGEEDSSTLNQNIDKEIKGYDISAANYRAEGAAALYRGKAARFGSYMSAAGTLLAGASQVAKINMGPSGGGGGGGDFSGSSFSNDFSVGAN